jgi:RNA polymerase sigma factor (sigma-70 family)
VRSEVRGATSESRTEEQELIRRAQRHEDAAIDELAERWRSYVFVICRSELGDRQDAEDATQLALVRVLSRIDQADPRRPLAPWVAQIARNVCRDLYDQQRRSPKTLSLSGAGPGGEDEPQGLEVAAPPRADPAVEHEARHSTATLQHHLNACLESRDKRNRLLVELHYLAGVPVKQLPDHWPDPLQRSESTLFNWLRQAREGLRRCLEARGVTSEMAQVFLDS